MQRKQILARAITLGLLLAMPCSAWATEYNQSIMGSYDASNKNDIYDNIRSDENNKYTYAFASGDALKVNFNDRSDLLFSQYAAGIFSIQEHIVLDVDKFTIDVVSSVSSVPTTPNDPPITFATGVFTENGIVEMGDVDINVTANTDNSMLGLQGIYNSGGSITIGNGDITVHAENSSAYGSEIHGIYCVNDGELNKKDGKVEVIATGTNNRAIGVLADWGGIVNLGIVDVSAKTVDGGSSAASTAIEIYRGTVNIDGGQISATAEGEVDNPEVYALALYDSKDDSVLNINQGTSNDVAINGNIYFEEDAAVNINLNTSNSVFNGGVQVANGEGGLALTLANGATWNNAASGYEYCTYGDEELEQNKDRSIVKELTIDGGIINNANAAKEIVISDYSGSYGEINTSGLVTVKTMEDTESVFNLNGSKGRLAVEDMHSTGSTISLDESSGQDTVSIAKLSGSDNNFIVRNTTAGQVHIAQNDSTKVNVFGESEVTDSLGSDLHAGLQSVADTVAVDTGNKVKTVSLEEGTITGTTLAMTDENGDIIWYSETPNQNNQGISEMASISLMTWRQENNDMNKRLGELRDSAGEHGVWVRMTRGESKYGNQNIKNQYNSYQLGYDEKLSSDKHWTVGAALTYTDAESSFRNGKGENKHKGLALYGSRLNDDGSFIDLIARYARLEHDFDVRGGAGKGDFDTNGYSLSAEYGKRFTQDNGFWIEPQVELTYGRVGSANYVTERGVNVRQEGMDSLVGRLGFALGKNLAKNKGNVYLRASYLYDFDGETDVSFSSGLQKRGFTQDLGGGWWEVGVGTNINFSEAAHLYLDVEKTYGGNVATPWQWNAGVRWSF